MPLPELVTVPCVFGSRIGHTRVSCDAMTVHVRAEGVSSRVSTSRRPARELVEAAVARSRAQGRS